MPYKVGDKVVLKRDEKRITPSAIVEIDKLPNRVATIKSVNKNSYTTHNYDMEEIDFWWQEKDIECLATEKPEPEEVDDPIDDRNEILDLRRD